MFAYCGNNPANKIDSTGHAAQDADNRFEAMAYSSGSIIGIALCIGVVAGISIAKQKINKKPVNLPSSQKVKLDTEHIFSGHMPDGPRNPKGNKDIFYGLTTQQVIKAIYEAYSTSSKLKTQGHNIKLIGYSPSFNLIIEMWLDVLEHTIKTAYPK